MTVEILIGAAVGIFCIGAILGSLIYYVRKQAVLKRETKSCRQFIKTLQEGVATAEREAANRLVMLQTAEKIIADDNSKQTAQERLEKIQIADKLFMRIHKKLIAGYAETSAAKKTTYMKYVVDMIRTEWREIV